MRVAIQGIAASFHEMAARQHFGEHIIPVECMTFQQLCEALRTQKADYAVMAIENTIAGSLLQNYALLIKYGFSVIGEVYLNIQMNLLGLPGQRVENIKWVKSHPIALQQCAEYLWSLDKVQWLEMEDTALAAKQVSTEKHENIAAIANTLAAEKYELEILASRIETDKQNFTRFLVLSRDSVHISSSNKASTCIQLSHERGSLAKVLHVFYENDINLTKIQSVPIVGKPYEYAFHIDCEWNRYSDFLKAIELIEKQANTIRILGEYTKGEFSLL